MPRHTDTQYPDPDLIKGYVTRKGVKTFHTEAIEFDAEPEVLELGGGWFGIGDGSKHQGEAKAHNAAVLASIAGTGQTACGEHELTELKAGGWARGLRRRGLEEHTACAKAREEVLRALEEAQYAGTGPESEAEAE